jgi:hypothetical protein
MGAPRLTERQREVVGAKGVTAEAALATLRAILPPGNNQERATKEVPTGGGRTKGGR